MKILNVIAIAIVFTLLGSNIKAQENITIIYLFRHAETMPPASDENPPNPKLSDKGLERAASLPNIFKNIEVTKIFTTNYNRTRMTVEPLAASKNLEIASYNPRDLEGFASELKKMEGVIVVSGHSNTTPELVKFLGGNSGPEIDHKVEYDRLYLVMIRNGEFFNSQLLRYGSSGE